MAIEHNRLTYVTQGLVIIGPHGNIWSDDIYDTPEAAKAFRHEPVDDALGVLETSEADRVVRIMREATDLLISIASSAMASRRIASDAGLFAQVESTGREG